MTHELIQISLQQVHLKAKQTTKEKKNKTKQNPLLIFTVYFLNIF